MSKDSERRQIIRALKKQARNNPVRQPQPDNPNNALYLIGSHFFDRSEEGKRESHRRTLLAHTYQPGDILIVDYAFGTPPSPAVPVGTTVRFRGWVEYEFHKGDENLPYQTPPDNQPGLYRSYSNIKVTPPEESASERPYIMLSASSVTLQDQELAEERIRQWGDKIIPLGFVRVGDLPDRTKS